MKLTGLPFTVRVADIDETMDDSLPPVQEVGRVSRLKARAIAKAAAPGDIIIAADTIVVIDGKKLYLLDKKDVFRGMGLWALRLQFTTENPGEIDKILMDYQGRAAFDAGSYTRGLYSRGVE